LIKNVIFYNFKETSNIFLVVLINYLYKIIQIK
jgi:hypothetical protein